MAEIRPLAALRYIAVDDLGAVLAPPYDVVSPTQQAQLYRQDRHNVIRLELARPAPRAGEVGRYERARRTLADWRRHNVLGLDADPTFYVYEEQFSLAGHAHRRRGIFAAVRLHEWDERIVLPHEHTRPKPKADRLSLLRACQTQFSPIFGLIDDPAGDVRSILASAASEVPLACADTRTSATGEIADRHLLWRVDAATAAHLTVHLRDRLVFIADGHHRYETALDYRAERRRATGAIDPAASFEHVLMLLVPAQDPGLRVLPTHRLLTLPSPIDADALEALWGAHFAIEHRKLPRGRSAATASERMLASGAGERAFVVLGLRSDVATILHLRQPPVAWHAPATWRELDVGLLQALVVEPLVRQAPGAEVEFTRDIGEALVHARGDRGLALLLNPVGVQQILDVARAGDRMPEKSTYFFPKVATGLVMYPLA